MSFDDQSTTDDVLAGVDLRGKRVVILLTGMTESNLRKQLDSFIKRAESTYDEWFTGGAKMTVFDK